MGHVGQVAQTHHSSPQHPVTSVCTRGPCRRYTSVTVDDAQGWQVAWVWVWG
jgi:hypothetical protein